MNICKLYVVRHGQSEHNRDEIVSGHVDPHLTELGKQQALLTKAKLAAITFDDVYSSDLQRAADTAALIYGSAVPSEHRLPGLRERNFGELDGSPGRVLVARIAETTAQYEALTDNEQWHFKHSHGMESDYEVSERFVETLAAIAQANPGKTILVAAHGGTLRTMLIKLGYATRRGLPSGSIDNASYVELDYSDGSFSVGTTSGIGKH